MISPEEKIWMNLRRFYMSLGELCGYESGNLAGIDFVMNNNGSWPAFLLGRPDTEAISDIASSIVNNEVPPFWIMEKKDDAMLSILEDHGIRAVRQWTGMTMESGSFVPATNNPEIEIRNNDPGSLGDWLELVNSTVMSGAQLGKEIAEAISSSDSFQHMVAYLEDKPVGTGLTFSEEGVCGLYFLSTESGQRGRGIGSRIFSELIRCGIEEGNHSLVLHATGMGEKIYHRTGFKSVNHYSVLWHLGS
jgi:hypothetical protein